MYLSPGGFFSFIKMFETQLWALQHMQLQNHFLRNPRKWRLNG